MKSYINNRTYDEHFLHGGDKGNYTGWAAYHTLSGEHVAAYYYENGLAEKLRLMRGSAPLIGNASYGVNVMFMDSNGETKATPRMREVEADEVTVVGHKPFEVCYFPFSDQLSCDFCLEFNLREPVLSSRQETFHISLRG